jgi:hypothetical protein
MSDSFNARHDIQSFLALNPEEIHSLHLPLKLLDPGLKVTM